MKRMLLILCLLGASAFPSLAQPHHNNSPAIQIQTQETGYWLTANSNKRHNKTCRWYMKSKGRFCQPNAGIACKICGG